MCYVSCLFTFCAKSSCLFRFVIKSVVYLLFEKKVSCLFAFHQNVSCLFTISLKLRFVPVWFAPYFLKKSFLWFYHFSKRWSVLVNWFGHPPHSKSFSFFVIHRRLLVSFQISVSCSEKRRPSKVKRAPQGKKKRRKIIIHPNSTTDFRAHFQFTT